MDKNVNLETIELADLLDLDALSHVLTSFSEATGVGSGITDMKSNVLVHANWQRICANFHRVNPEMCKRCIESDTILANQLNKGKEYIVYKCRNGMTDAATPILLGGRHIANAFIGQFHTSEPDENAFRQQARKHGFDEDDYISALRETTVVPPEKLPSMLKFLVDFSKMATSMGMDRFRAEEATENIRHLRNYLSNIIDSMPSLLAGVDPEGSVSLWNSEAQKQTGISREKAIGQPLKTVLPRLKNDLNNIKKVISYRQIYAQSKREYQVEDKTYYEDIHIYPLVANGVDGAVIRIDDATKEYEIEEQLSQSRKMEAIGLMAGGVAHDLNNVLSGIISYPELILMDLPQDHKVVPDIEMIKESGLRAANIVADLLTIARGVAVAKFPANLNDLVDEYLNSAEFKELSSRHPEISIEKHQATEAVNISCSLTHIGKCIMNVVTNAAESIPSAGRVDVVTQNIEITNAQNAQQLAPGSYALLSISDTGPGVSQTDLDRIFEPFYSKKKMGRSGTGLGLAIVWNCVQDHHGKIMVHSSEKGTTFDLYFPSITPPDSPPKNSVDTTATPRGNGETILVIDDEGVQRDIACKILKNLNYAPTAVVSGEQAIDYIRQTAVDLIILDMMMDPGINGLITYQEIKKIDPDQRAIIASGYAQNALVNEALELGHTLFIGKPYTINQLGLAVKKILEIHS